MGDVKFLTFYKFDNSTRKINLNKIDDKFVNSKEEFADNVIF